MHEILLIFAHCLVFQKYNYQAFDRRVSSPEILGHALVPHVGLLCNLVAVYLSIFTSSNSPRLIVVSFIAFWQLL